MLKIMFFKFPVLHDKSLSTCHKCLTLKRHCLTDEKTLPSMPVTRFATDKRPLTCTIPMVIATTPTI